MFGGLIFIESWSNAFSENYNYTIYYTVSFALSVTPAIWYFYKYHVSDLKKLGLFK